MANAERLVNIVTEAADTAVRSENLPCGERLADPRAVNARREGQGSSDPQRGRALGVKARHNVYSPTSEKMRHHQVGRTTRRKA